MIYANQTLGGEGWLWLRVSKTVGGWCDIMYVLLHSSRWHQIWYHLEEWGLKNITLKSP